MAAFMNVHKSASVEDKNPDKPRQLEINHSFQQPTNVSSHLLYPDKYADCYQEDKLTVIGRASNTFIKNQLKTVDVPQSSVLSRLKRFLPEMSLANRDMASKLVSDPDSANTFNIEHLGESNELHVEMNLSVVPPELLGVEVSSSDESESDSESESDQLSQENGDYFCTEVEQTLKLHKTSSSKCTKPRIQLIEDVESTEELFR